MQPSIINCGALLAFSLLCSRVSGFGDTIQYRERLSDFYSYQYEGQRYWSMNETVGRVRVSGCVTWKGEVDVSQFTLDTYFDVYVGDCGFGGYICDDPAWRPGKQCATFPVMYYGDDGDVRCGKLWVKWNKNTLRFILGGKTDSYGTDLYGSGPAQRFFGNYWGATEPDAGGVAGKSEVYVSVSDEDWYWEKTIPISFTGQVVRTVVTMDGADFDAATVLTHSTTWQQGWIQWPASAGGNGHWYQTFYNPGGSWRAALTNAERQGGYLATITSLEENAFVYQFIKDHGMWGGEIGPVFGGYYPAAAVGTVARWSWVTGEPWEFTNWKDQYAGYDYSNLYVWQRSPTGIEQSGSPGGPGGTYFWSHGHGPEPGWSVYPMDDQTFSFFVAERDTPP